MAKKKKKKKKMLTAVGLVGKKASPKRQNVFQHTEIMFLVMTLNHIGEKV